MIDTAVGMEDGALAFMKRPASPDISSATPTQGVSGALLRFSKVTATSSCGVHRPGCRPS